MKLLAKAMEKVPNGKFLIDGFPRNEDNVAGWDKDMQDKVSWTEGWSCYTLHSPETRLVFVL